MSKFQRRLRIAMTALNGILFVACLAMFFNPDTRDKARVFFGLALVFNALGFAGGMLKYLDGKYELQIDKSK